MTSISASSLTSIAVCLALCAMRLTLGRDIGVVMAKGVALGVICTIVILPALILTFDQQVEKYKHRTIVPKQPKLRYYVTTHAMPIEVVFLVLLVPFVVAQQKTEVYYTLFDSLPQDLTGIVGTNKLGEDFGMTTSHFIQVHDDLTATEVSDLCDELKDVDGITQVVSLDSITGPGFQTELLPDSIMEILQSGGYKLILANSSYKPGTDAINNQLTEMNGLIKAVDPNGVITGEGAMTKDLIEVADVDFKNVNVWSIMAVAAIILISFRSLSIPVLLVASIEAAISINMGIPYFTGTQLPFIASIVIGTIQLGATVDYSILMTTRYHEERSYGRTPREAAQQSLEHCSQSILTSGLTFFAATVGVAAISKMELLRSICLLCALGAAVAVRWMGAKKLAVTALAGCGTLAGSAVCFAAGEENGVQLLLLCGGDALLAAALGLGLRRFPPEKPGMGSLLLAAAVAAAWGGVSFGLLLPGVLVCAAAELALCCKGLPLAALALSGVTGAALASADPSLAPAAAGLACGCAAAAVLAPARRVEGLVVFVVGCVFVWFWFCFVCFCCFCCLFVCFLFVCGLGCVWFC